MIKNITHSSTGCNGMANNDDYHGLEMYKNHAKDSTTEGYMQPDPTTMECGHHGYKFFCLFVMAESIPPK